MNCPDCKTTEMKIDFEDIEVDGSFFEVVYKCPKCGAGFFGTIYRDLEQALNEPDCKKCEEKKDALRSYEGTQTSNRLL